MSVGTAKPPLVVEAATADNLSELATVFARSFHPTSPYMLQAIPDTPLTRAWWIETNRQALEDRQIRLDVVVDQGTGRIVAICRYRLTDVGDKSIGWDAGLWSRIPLTPDHDQELCDRFISFMANQRTEVMAIRRHIMIELLGTIHDVKGQGAGSKLLGKVCAEAERENVPIFVEANGGVVGFYAEMGFKEKMIALMPGGKYTEHIMVREASVA